MNPVQEKKRSLWELFSMVENGKPKNTFLLYSFALSFFFLAVYAFAYIALAGPVERMFAGVSMGLAAWMEALLPAAAATVVCALCQLAAKNKRLAAAAFIWLLLYAAVFFIIALFSFEKEDFPLFLNLFLQLTVFPLLLGGGWTFCIAVRSLKGTAGGDDKTRREGTK